MVYMSNVEACSVLVLSSCYEMRVLGVRAVGEL